MANRNARTGHQKHSYFSIVFWSLSLIAVTVYSGWRFGWIPFGDGRELLTDYLPPKSSNTVAATGSGGPRSEPDGEPEQFAANPRSQSGSDMLFQNHSEPELAEPSLAGRTGAATRSAMGHSAPRELNLPPVSEIPAQGTVFTSTSAAHNFSGTPIVQTSNEVEAGQPTNQVRVAAAPAATRPTELASTAVSAPDLEEIDQLLQANEYLKAHRLLSGLYWKHPEWREALQSRIDMTAKSIYFARQPHYLRPYEVQPGDQLRNIASKYNVTWEYLSRLNGLDPQRMRAGQNLKVLKGPFAVIVDLSDFELIVHAYGYYVKRYHVGIGKEDSTPLGTFQVQNKLKDPVYYGPDGIVIANDDPENPLGEFWIDIGDGYGIHGTIDPDSIGKAESKGCIRMGAADIEEVYGFLVNGSEVTIRR